MVDDDMVVTGDWWRTIIIPSKLNLKNNVAAWEKGREFSLLHLV